MNSAVKARRVHVLRIADATGCTILPSGDPVATVDVVAEKVAEDVTEGQGGSGWVELAMQKSE